MQYGLQRGSRLAYRRGMEIDRKLTYSLLMTRYDPYSGKPPKSILPGTTFAWCCFGVSLFFAALFVYEIVEENTIRTKGLLFSLVALGLGCHYFREPPKGPNGRSDE